MATKNSITPRHEQVKQVRALVATGEAASVSEFVQHAVAVALHDAAAWKEMLEDAMQRTGGPLTKKERAWADGVLTANERANAPRKGKAG